MYIIIIYFFVCAALPFSYRIFFSFFAVAAAIVGAVFNFFIFSFCFRFVVSLSVYVQ